MSRGSKIGWTEDTWNPILGCDRVSPGCDGCYAIRSAHRLAHNPNEKVKASAAGTTHYAGDRLDWTGQVNLLSDRLAQPFRWRNPRRVFVNSQSDLFHKDVPAEYIAVVFLVMAATPRHTYQVLTKRHGRMRSLLNSERFFDMMTAAARKAYYENLLPIPGDLGYRWPLPNVHLGVSVEDQDWADKRIPALLDTPAAVRWVSAEPLLGPVSLDLPRCDTHDRRDLFTDTNGFQRCSACAADGWSGELSYGHWLRQDGLISWVVVGGESGPTARRMDLAWARSLAVECASEGVPFYFKQLGTVLAREVGATGKGEDPAEWPEPFPQDYPVEVAA